MMNSTVDTIEINADYINLQTFRSSILLNLITKQAIIIENIPRKLVQFNLAQVKYGYDKRYTGEIYLLNYAGNVYLLPENFYSDFSELKTVLESTY